MKTLVMRSTVALVITGSASAVPMVPAGAGQPLPKVWVGGPSSAPCYRSVELGGRSVDRAVACYEVRPPTIAMSEDGDGFLSGLHWRSWGPTSAAASGLRFVRCWGYYPPGHRDPRCLGATQRNGGYNVPVTVFLGKPVATAHGPLFSVLAEGGAQGQWCVAPSGVACNVPPSKS